MPSNKQRRNAAKRHLQHQLERRAKREQAQRRRLAVVGVVVAVLVIAGGVWLVTSMVSGGNDEASDAGSTKAADVTGDAYSASDTDTDTASGGSSDETSQTDAADTSGLCSYPDSGTPAKDVDPPSDLNPPTDGTVDATVTFNSGDITMGLDRSGAPCAVNSFVSLATQHYFDDTTCHRLTTSESLKVLQCGDPSGTGAGGPGYSFADELSGQETYDRGTIAMANAGPDTNGSQFFIVYGDSQLPANYDVLGSVTDGMDVIDAIADKGVDGGGQDGAPANPVTIESVSLASSHRASSHRTS